MLTFRWAGKGWLRSSCFKWKPCDHFAHLGLEILKLTPILCSHAFETQATHGEVQMENDRHFAVAVGHGALASFSVIPIQGAPFESK